MLKILHYAPRLPIISKFANHSVRMLCLFLSLSLVACSSDEDPVVTEVESAKRVDLILMQSTQVVEFEIKNPIIATGTIAALKVTDISPMVSGLVEEVYVRVGDRVKKGDPLMKIRQTEINLRIDQLTHRLELANAEFEDARKDLNTNLGLSKSGVVSQNMTDDTQTRFAITQARVGIAKAQLRTAEQNLVDTVSIAPFDGVITERSINEGAYVQTMRMGMDSSAPLQIQQIDVVVALLTLPESTLSRIKVGTAARITIDGLGLSFDSQIHVINDRLDFQSRTIDVRVGIKNEDYVIKPGLFARAEIYPPSRMALIVNRRAVLGYEANYVYINNSGVAKKILVTIKELDTQNVEITSGLDLGQSVLVGNNLSRLQDGSKINVKEV